MTELGITMDELSRSNMMIHGFNLNGERTVGIIRVNLSIAELSYDTFFHVIDANTSFKLLLGRPWAYENGVVASNLHQCLKYYRGGERKINADVKPFTKADSLFADARFFETNGTSSELLPAMISSTDKRIKKSKDVAMAGEPISDPLRRDRPSIKAKVENESRLTTAVKKEEKKQNTSPPVLRYIPMSRRKEEESPFAECRDLEPTFVEQAKHNRVIKKEWIAKVVTPLPGTTRAQIMRPPLAEFTPSSNQTSHEQQNGVFDPNAYKLLEKAGYDFENSIHLGSVIQAEPYGLNEEQKKIFKQEQNYTAAKVGIGYELPTPMKVTASRKQNAASSQHITAEEDKERENDVSQIVGLVFGRIAAPVIRPRNSVFDRLGRSTSSLQQSPLKDHVNVFKILGRTERSECVNTSNIRVKHYGHIGPHTRSQ
ncbi:hypothetical protein vseg_000952 [Gypsophila vaccaria]